MWVGERKGMRMTTASFAIAAALLAGCASRGAFAIKADSVRVLR